MPATTGGSHSLAAFASMLVGTAISKYVWNALPSFVELAEATGRLIVAVTGVAVSAEWAGQVLIATVLAFAWGVLYHVTRH